VCEHGLASWRLVLAVADQRGRATNQ
jgi:hypothetical protein